MVEYLVQWNRPIHATYHSKQPDVNEDKENDQGIKKFLLNNFKLIGQTSSMRSKLQMVSSLQLRIF
jgi:hypothetical protein